jgi:hypothetical protein
MKISGSKQTNKAIRNKRETDENIAGWKKIEMNLK